jgi:hypothetical protein
LEVIRLASVECLRQALERVKRVFEAAMKMGGKSSLPIGFLFKGYALARIRDCRPQSASSEPNLLLGQWEMFGPEAGVIGTGAMPKGG